MIKLLLLYFFLFIIIYFVQKVISFKILNKKNKSNEKVNNEEFIDVEYEEVE